MKIAIITTSVRDGRLGLGVANWILEYAKQNSKAEFEIVDLKNYNLPIFASPFATSEQLEHVSNWKQKISEFDGYIFVVAEYNHSFTGAIKNALDFLKPEVTNKTAAFVGYGGLGGARAIEQLRVVFGELAIVGVQKTVNFLLSTDFNESGLLVKSYHESSADLMLTQLLDWSNKMTNI